jgi:hypothetical protein
MEQSAPEGMRVNLTFAFPSILSGPTGLYEDPSGFFSMNDIHAIREIYL